VRTSAWQRLMEYVRPFTVRALDHAAETTHRCAAERSQWTEELRRQSDDYQVQVERTRVAVNACTRGAYTPATPTAPVSPDSATDD